MKTHFAKIKSYISAHKWLSGFIFFVLIFLVWFLISKVNSTSPETRYVTSKVERSTLITSITGSGQVSSSGQLDLKTKASGDVVYVGTKEGQFVRKGQLILEIDPTQAQKSVRDAETNLESAKISLSKLVEPADQVSTIQAQNNLSSANDSLTKAYSDGWNSVSQTFVDLPSVISGLDQVLNKYDVKQNQDNASAYSDMVYNNYPAVTTFKSMALAKYVTAKNAYDKNFSDFRDSSRDMSTSSIENLIAETQNSSQTISDALKAANDFLNFVKNSLTTDNRPIPAVLTNAQNNLSTYTNSVNNHISSLISITSTITSSKYQIAQSSASLTKLQNGADALDISSAKLAVTQRENALQDAKDNLSNYYVTAPFDGTVAALNFKLHETVGNGSAAATMTTKGQIATISLNEVDAAKVKVGDHANMTFDAVDGLNISGVVSEVDTIGTVSQGVVTYAITITFDTSDDRVKPGMTVNSTIITNVISDVIVVPTSAVKTSGGNSYVQVFDSIPTTTDTTSSTGFVSSVPPKQVYVTVGASNDSQVEIKNGLSEGQNIVTKTTTSTTKTTSTSQTPSLLNAIGGNRAGGAASGAVRGTGIRN